MRRQVATYLNEEEFQQLARQAARRNVSLSRYVKERLLKADEGSGAETEAEAIAEAIVTAAERRFADGIDRSIARALKPLAQRLCSITAMLDQFALTMLINTPEIAESKKEQAIAAGERRHRGWQRAVQQLLMEMQSEVVASDNQANGNGAHA
jgi:hypothetical protein